MNIRPRPYDHPDAVKLEAEVQLEYIERYDGEGDTTPLDPTMFRPPGGLFLVAYDDQERPVATGAWRTQEENGEGYSDGDAELKRMYVIPACRGIGLARRVLAVLEDDARTAGRRRMVLETGTQQPEAISLYLSSGYTPTQKFGHFREYEDSRCFAKSLGVLRKSILVVNDQLPWDVVI